MKLISMFFTLMLGSVPVAGFACDRQINSDLPVIDAPGGYIFFKERPLQLSDGEYVVGEESLAVYYYGCDGGVSKLVGDLPYLAATGKIHSVFFIDPLVQQSNQLVVLHGVEIRADTGVPFVGDYYSVHVFDVSAGVYAKNERALGYFGFGGDVVNNYEDRVPVYLYPYKTEADIRAEINSSRYIDWMAGRTVSFVVKGNVPLYEYPVMVESPVGRIEQGTVLKQLDAQAGWLEVSGTTKYAKGLRGWVMRDDLYNAIR